MTWSILPRMELARVIGTVVATQKHASLTGVRLLLVQPHDHQGASQGDPVVAADALQAGVGDTVRLCMGREGVYTLPVPFAPVDVAVLVIVSDVNARSLPVDP